MLLDINYQISLLQNIICRTWEIRVCSLHFFSGLAEELVLRLSLGYLRLSTRAVGSKLFLQQLHPSTKGTNLGLHRVIWLDYALVPR